MKEVQPTPYSVDQLQIFPVPDDDETINHVKDEFAAYKLAAADVPKDTDCLPWWKVQEALPAWRCRKSSDNNSATIGSSRTCLFSLGCCDHQTAGILPQGPDRAHDHAAIQSRTQK